jgi:hypothetical protein
MPIHRDDDWLQIAELDDQDQIRFTPEFQAMMGDLGWGGKARVPAPAATALARIQVNRSGSGRIMKKVVSAGPTRAVAYIHRLPALRMQFSSLTRLKNALPRHYEIATRSRGYRWDQAPGMRY